MALRELSEGTLGWLGEWLAVTGNDRQEMQGRLTEGMKNELLAVQHKYGGPVEIVYRGTNRAGYQNYHSDTVFSTTLDPQVAENFGPHVYSIRPKPTDILLDTTILNDREIMSLGGFPEELEVILLPGTYAVDKI